MVRNRRVLIVLLVVILFISSHSHGFGDLYFFDGPLSLYPTFLIIKEEQPEFLQRLKDSWRIPSDDDAKKEEAIAGFLQDLDRDIMSKGGLNESNFNGVMYTSFKKTIETLKHRSVFRALMAGFPDEIDYIDRTGKLHPNLYPLRDSVKKAILGLYAEEIYPLPLIKVKQYTNIEELNLFNAVDVRISDGSTKAIPIKWNLKSNYNGNIYGEYIIKGFLDLADFQYITFTEKAISLRVFVLPYRMPSGGKTIIIDGEGYSVDFNLKEEIREKIGEGEDVFIKLSDSIFIDKYGHLMEVEDIPAVTYHFSNEILGYYERMDGEIVE